MRSSSNNEVRRSLDALPTIIVKSHCTLTFLILPTEAALRIEGLRDQPEKMANGARLVRDFQPPFRAVSKQRFLRCSPFSRRSDAPCA
jgi:hypothetical protein